MEAYEFDEATEKKLEQFEKSLEDVQADIIKYSIKKQEPVFAQRDAALKSVENFWLDALYNCPAVAVYLDDVDREAMSSLKEIRVERDAEDPRNATIHFDFGDNDFFSNKTLTKHFKVAKDAEPLGSDDFDFSTQVESAKISIDWKSEEKNLAKLHPTEAPKADDDGELDADEILPGSFFSSFFESDPNGLSSSIGDNLINEFYPRAHDYYTGAVDDDPELYEDFDSEDEEDEDDDDKEIDLEDEEDEDEKPKKKAKH